MANPERYTVHFTKEELQQVVAYLDPDSELPASVSGETWRKLRGALRRGLEEEAQITKRRKA